MKHFLAQKSCRSMQYVGSNMTRNTNKGGRAILQATKAENIYKEVPLGAHRLIYRLSFVHDKSLFACIDKQYIHIYIFDLPSGTFMPVCFEVCNKTTSYY